MHTGTCHATNRRSNRSLARAMMVKANFNFVQPVATLLPDTHSTLRSITCSDCNLKTAVYGFAVL